MPCYFEVHIPVLTTVKFLPKIDHLVKITRVKYSWNHTRRFFVIQNLSSKTITSCKEFISGLYIGENQVEMKQRYFCIFDYFEILTAVSDGALLFSAAKTKFYGDMFT